MSHNQLAKELLQEWQHGRSSRAVVTLQAQAQLGLARVAQQAALQIARVEAVACVGRRALFEAALVTQTEQSLALLVPLASGRLQAIADVATLGIAEIVSDSVRLVTR